MCKLNKKNLTRRQNSDEKCKQDHTSQAKVEGEAERDRKGTEERQEAERSAFFCFIYTYIYIKDGHRSPCIYQHTQICIRTHIPKEIHMSPDINGFIKENEIQVGGSERRHLLKADPFVYRHDHDRGLDN